MVETHLRFAEYSWKRCFPLIAAYDEAMLDRTRKLRGDQEYLEEEEKIRQTKTGRSIDNSLKYETSREDEGDGT